MSHQVIIYTDGSCNQNKNTKDKSLVGVGGIGVVMRFGKFKKDFCEGRFINTTSARMEIMAIIRAMESITIKEGHTNKFDIVIHTDNQYCSNTVNKGWYRNWKSHNNSSDRPNMDLWDRFFKIYDKLGGRQKVTVKWIKGHNGHPLNELADKLANEGRKKRKKIQDQPQKEE